MNWKSARGIFAAAAALLMLAALTGCRADNIFFSVKNGSGGVLHDVKVTYPDGALNIGTLEVSTIYGAFRHLDGPGDRSISYTTEGGHTYSSSGPHVTGNEKGDVKVSIDGSSADFDTEFKEGQQ